MSAHEARPEVRMPGQAIYGEDHPCLRWQMVAITVLSWATTIAGGVTLPDPHLDGFAVPALMIGGFFALLFTYVLAALAAVGIRVSEDGIQIGGLRGRDRRLRRGTWPPRKLNVGGQRKAVFTCPWQATDGLFLLTEKADIKRFRQDLRQFRRPTRPGKRSTPRVKAPAGVFSDMAAFADALLVISNDPARTESDPQEIGSQFGRNVIISPVRSPVWTVPIRDPAAFQAAIQRLPQAPHVHDHLPAGHARFEVS